MPQLPPYPTTSTIIYQNQSSNKNSRRDSFQTPDRKTQARNLSPGKKPAFRIYENNQKGG